MRPLAILAIPLQYFTDPNSAPGYGPRIFVVDPATCYYYSQTIRAKFDSVLELLNMRSIWKGADKHTGWCLGYEFGALERYEECIKALKAEGFIESLQLAQAPFFERNATPNPPWFYYIDDGSMCLKCGFPYSDSCIEDRKCSACHATFEEEFSNEPFEQFPEGKEALS